MKEFQSKQQQQEQLSKSISTSSESLHQQTQDIAETSNFNSATMLDPINQPAVDSNIFFNENTTLPVPTESIKQNNPIEFDAIENVSTAYYQQHESVPTNTNNAPVQQNNNDQLCNVSTAEYWQKCNELNVEQQKTHELNVLILNQNSQIATLQNEIEKSKLNNSTQLTMEIGPLQEQLQSHVQTIGILVGEKAELSAALNTYQTLAKSKVTEIEELQGRLNASRHRVQVLEKEIGTVRSSYEKYDSSQQRLCNELEHSQEIIVKLKKHLDDSNEQVSELKQKVSLKSKDIENMEINLAQIKSDLSLSQLRVEQFSAGDSIETDSKIETLMQQKLFFEQQVQDLQKMVQQLGTERDQSSQQYQNYVQQLNKETASLAQQLHEYVADNERLSKREESLVKHVGELERQIQQQIARQKTIKDVQQHDVVTGPPQQTDAGADLNNRIEQLEGAKAALEVRITNSILI